MTSTIRNVIVIGAGGSIGPAILIALEPHFSVSIVSRVSSTAITPARFRTFRVGDNYPTEDLLQAFRGQDAVVCCISPWASEKQHHIIDIAVQAGVKRFIPGEFGNDSTNARAIAMIPPLQIRNDVVAHLRAQEVRGLSWTAIINGQILDWGLANGFLGFDLVEHKAMMFDDGDQPFSVSTLALISTAVANSLLEPDFTKNKYIYVSSFTTTQNEILDTLKIVHEAPWTVERVRARDKLREAQEILQKGGDARAGFRYLLLIQSYTSGYGSDLSGREFNKALHLPIEMLQDVVRTIKPTETY